MATRKQEIVHALEHFFTVYTVVLFMKVWFPTQDFFRRIWWKAWGHDPKKDANFHLSRMTFDHEMGNRILIGSSVHMLAVYMYGDPRIHESKAWRQFNLFMRFKYLPYDQFKAIEDLWSYQFPGRMILDWFMKVDGISSERVKSVRAFNPEFETFYQELMVKEKHKPKEAPKE